MSNCQHCKYYLLKEKPIIESFTCDNCGKTIIWHTDDPRSFEIENQCHRIDLGKMGYGSELDGYHVSFDLCDTCLTSIVYGLKNKNKIL